MPQLPKIGDIGHVVWTNCNSQYSAKAEVVKLNKKTLRAKLLEEVPCTYGEPYPVGREIIVPVYPYDTVYNEFTKEN